jgi:hypothetical protein
MKHEHKTELAHLAAEITDLRTQLGDVQEQGRLTLELVRAIVELLMPKGDRSGPSLDELLATLIVQLRELTTIARATQAAVGRLEQRVGPNGVAAPLGRAGHPGVIQS